MRGWPPRTRIDLSALHAAAFVGIGVYLPFFPVWLASKALDPAAIGIVLAIPIVIRIIATAPLLAWADGAIGPRRLLLASHAVQAAGYPVLIILDQPVAIGAMVAVLALAQAAVVPTNDLVTTEAVRRDPRLDYGRLRLWGSIAFLLTSVVAGLLIEAAGPVVVIVILTVAPLAAMLATKAALPSEDRPLRIAGQGSPGAAPRTRLPRALWLLMGAAAATQASHAGLYAFGSIHWRALGFTDTAVGWLWAVGVVAEIFVFVLLGRSVGRGSASTWLLIAGSSAALVRFSLMAIEPGFAVTVGLQILHGLSFGASHLGAMAALAALAPDGARGRAQGVLGSCNALAMASATLVSGALYETGGPLVFAAMAPLGAVGLCLAWAAALTATAHPHRAGEGG